MSHRLFIPILLLFIMHFAGCTAAPRPGDLHARTGDEIVICGQFVHTGAPVVLWMDPAGYDAYRTEKRFAPWDRSAWTADSPGPSTPNRYGVRFAEPGRGPNASGERLPPDLLEQVRGGGWDLPSLQRVVDQFVIHYDVCGTSRECFRVLHDVRGLSVHFLLDVDGTIYQTLDLKERAWHATTSNDRSIGIEIAHIGAYPPTQTAEIAAADPIASLPPILNRWYSHDPSAPAGRRTRITFPATIADGGVRTPNFIPRPERELPIVGFIQDTPLIQYDFTPEQYNSLAKLTAALCMVFPSLPCEYPKDATGALIRGQLSDEQLVSYRGLLGHYHIQPNKTDPGPAFDWNRVVYDAKRLMGQVTVTPGRGE